MEREGFWRPDATQSQLLEEDPNHQILICMHNDCLLTGQQPLQEALAALVADFEGLAMRRGRLGETGESDMWRIALVH